MNAEELLAYIGRGWRLERTIVDHRAGETYSFRGRTRGRLVERGELRRGGETWPARRAYRFGAKGPKIFVRFEDGRDFFSFDCGEWTRVTFEHTCAPDLYRGALSLDPDGWTLAWRITGPAKDLTIESVYR